MNISHANPRRHTRIRVAECYGSARSGWGVLAVWIALVIVIAALLTIL
ncbi:hypothetical protein [Nocardia sp. XZ_19_385]|nr:hypothetical protein [Nocardia sp. XZ_19_385]